MNEPRDDSIGMHETPDLPPFLVSLFKDEERKHFVGTGFVIAPEWVLTCKHVVVECKPLFVYLWKYDKWSFIPQDKIYSFQSKLDLALVHIGEAINDVVHCATLIKGMDELFWKNLHRYRCYAFGGNPLGAFLLDKQIGVQSGAKRNQIREVQVLGGIEEGFSGGPIAVEGPTESLVVGIAWLGGKKISHSRIIASDAVLNAIREFRIDIYERLRIGDAGVIINAEANGVRRFDPFADAFLHLPKNHVRRAELFEKAKHELIKANNGSTLSLAADLKGPGGFGKTTLAIDLIHDDDIRNAFPGISWVTVGQTPNLLVLLRKLIFQSTGKQAIAGEISDAQGELDQAFGRFPGKILVVLDDVWSDHDANILRRMLPNVCYLVTSRIKASLPDNSNSIIFIDEADEVTCQNIFCSTLPDEVIIPEDVKEQIRYLVVTRLGRWPLLISLVASDLALQLNKKKQLRTALLDINDRLTEEGLEDFDDTLTDEAKAEHRRKSVKLTITSSLRRLSVEDASRYESLGIFPGDVSIPITALASLWKITPRQADQIAMDFDGQSLLRYEAAVKTEEGRLPAAIRLHDVFWNYLEEKLKADPVKSFALNAALVSEWGNLYELPDSYSWRYLAHHLKNSGQLNKLKSLLIEFEWLNAKFLATDAAALIDDTTIFSDDRDVTLIRQALEQSSPALSQDQGYFRNQLYGRLLSIVEGEIPKFLEKMRQTRGVRWLRPLSPCITQACSAWRRTLSFPCSITFVALCADGSKAVICTFHNELHLWNVEKEQCLKLGKHEHSVTSVAISETGKWVISSDKETLLLWSVEAEETREMKGNGGNHLWCSINDEGSSALSRSDGNKLLYWNLGAETQSELRHREGRICGVAISADGSLVIIAMNFGSRWDNGFIEVFNLADGTERTEFFRETFDSHRRQIRCGDRAIDTNTIEVSLRLLHRQTGMRFNSVVLFGERLAINDNARLVLAASREALCLFDIEKGKATAFGRHLENVTTMSISADGKRAISGSSDRTVRLWDLTGIEMETPAWQDGEVIGISMILDGQHAIIISDEKYRLWNLNTGQSQDLSVPRTFSHRRQRLSAFSEDGQKTVSRSDSGMGIVFWDFKEGKENNLGATEDDRSIDLDHWEPIALSADGKWAISEADGQIILWDLDKGDRRILGPTDKFLGSVESVAISADGKWAISAGNTLWLWNLESQKGDELALQECHSQSVAMNADGRWAVTGSSNGIVNAWDLQDRYCRELFQYPCDGYSTICLAIDKSGRWAVSASAKILHLWDLPRNKLVSAYPTDTRIRAVGISAKGENVTVIVGDNDGWIHLLNLEGR